MTPLDAATRHVVERCPRCGVEHETSVDAVCEACDSPLRAWCRRHGREIGWLDGPWCDRCADDAGLPRRRAPAPPPAPIPDPIAIGMMTLEDAMLAAGMPYAADLVPAEAAPAPVEAAPVPAEAAAVPAAAEEAAKPAARPGLVDEVIVSVMVMLMSIAGGVVVGVVPGLLFVLMGGWELREALLKFGLGGAVLGVLLGILFEVDHHRQIRRTPPAG